MPKIKGQISVFIILGIVLVAIVLSYFYLIHPAGISAEGPQTDTQSVKLFIDSCLGETTRAGIYLVGHQGGYLDVPSPYVNLLPLKAPYYYYEGKLAIPEKGAIEREISTYVNANIEKCLSNFTSFRQQGIIIETGSPLSNVTISSNDVTAYLKYPIKITKDDRTSTLESFTQNAGFNMNEKYNIATQIINEQQKDSETIPIGYLTELSMEKGFKFILGFPEQDIVVFNLIFNETGDKFIYAFAIKYNWTVNKSLEEE